MTIKAVVIQIYNEGGKAKRIILKAASGRRIDTLLADGSEAEIKQFIVKVNEALPIPATPELPYEASDTLELDEKTGNITVMKPVPPEPIGEPI